MASENFKRKRRLEILRTAIRRIFVLHFKEPHRFTMHDVGIGIDGSLMPYACPEGVKRLVFRLAEQGYLKRHGKRYELTVATMPYLESLLDGSLSSNQDLLLLSGTEFQVQGDDEVTLDEAPTNEDTKENSDEFDFDFGSTE